MKAKRKSDGKIIEVTPIRDFMLVNCYESLGHIYPAYDLDFNVENFGEEVNFPTKTEGVNIWYCGRTVCCNNGASDYLKRNQCDKALCPRRIPFPDRDIDTIIRAKNI